MVIEWVSIIALGNIAGRPRESPGNLGINILCLMLNVARQQIWMPPIAAGFEGATVAGAVTLALGIGLQNFPEGFAVAMPLRRHGLSRFKSFLYGQSSALVEPIAAVIGAWAVMTFEPILPYALAFAAGAMIFVVVEEVIPETQRDKYTDIASMGFIIGFVVMMTLDVALG